jgi:succinate dehydrogenase/fumarate reductase cytochrome b subunit
LAWGGVGVEKILWNFWKFLELGQEREQGWWWLWVNLVDVVGA